MKEILKKIVIFIITIEAKLTLLRYRPKIVAVTGSVGKTSTKDAIYTALSAQFRVRKNKKSLNSEIGVPLTIMGLETGWSNPISWLKNIFLGLIRIIYFPKYPEWLVLETGIDKPGDMRKTASWLKPRVAVITAFGTVPVHVEFFDSPEDVMAEKAKLIDYLVDNGVVILNADDPNVLKLKGRAVNKVYTYGLNEEADIVASNYSVNYENGKPTGILFKVNYGGKVIPITMNNVIGDQYIYPVLVALSVGIGLDVSIVPMTTTFSEYQAPPGRMNLVKGENNSTIIDDSYNASPIAMQKAVETLSGLETSGKKIAILGDMLEIGRFSASEHRRIGEMVYKSNIDVLITVGRRSELIAEEAIKNGMSEKNVFLFEESEEAIEKVKEFVQNRNIILVKGSQGIRTEKIVKEIMEEKDRVDELLVRQEKEWANQV